MNSVPSSIIIIIFTMVELASGGITGRYLIYGEIMDAGCRSQVA